MCASILWRLKAVGARVSLRLRFQVLVCALTAGAVLAGCRTPPVHEESFSRAFDAQRVAQLSHEAAKVAFHAKFWAGLDLRFAAFTPTQLDYDAVAYLDAISRRVGWIALKVEKNPTSPRVSSKRAYDFVAHEAMMLRQRYQPASFRRSGVRIDYLLTLLDQIARYYDQNKQPETLKETMRVGSHQWTVHQTLPRGN